MSRIALVALVGFLALPACSSGGSGNGTTGGPTFTLTDNMTVTPSNITVAAGTTITFFNSGTATPHTATSEAAAGSFTKAAAPNGFTFDTGDIQPGNSATMTVPAGVASGTVQPWFCQIHTKDMVPADPTITIK